MNPIETRSDTSTEVAAFDFDGTLTTGDCFVPFLVATAGRAALARSAVVLPVAVLTGRLPPQRDAVKEHLVRSVLRGRAEEELAAIGAALAHTIVERSLRPSMVHRLKWHRHRGHCVVIVTSSLRFYVEPVAEVLGADSVLCTELAFENGIATGALRGANCRGQEKVDRLLASGRGRPPRLWVYGDSRGDAALLALADDATLVRGRGLRVTRSKDRIDA